MRLPNFDHMRGGLKPRTPGWGWVLRQREVVDGNGGEQLGAEAL